MFATINTTLEVVERKRTKKSKRAQTIQDKWKIEKSISSALINEEKKSYSLKSGQAKLV